MHRLNLSADELVERLLNLPSELNLCLLDSCGVSHLNSHLLVAGISPIETVEINENEAEETLIILNQKISAQEVSSILTISYDFGLKLNSIKSRFGNAIEPDIFLALFDVLIIHDYDNNETYLKGNAKKFEEIANLLLSANPYNFPQSYTNSSVESNLSRSEYLSAIEKIQDLIRQGDTYQTNLTQQLTAILPQDLTHEKIFLSLRNHHPAPFSSFIRRNDDVVISASPERFLRVEGKIITTNPIKGTRPRGSNPEEDGQLQNELLVSEKDRAENIMIVDLLRNDIGRVCAFGSVEVEKLCELEKHPSLFHLVSTVSGKLRESISLSDILRATFPCGSITGAPKIRTMKIIDEIETAPRGLSMGAIGFIDFDKTIDLSVAIRTMVIRERLAIFNVGGGIVIDSDPQSEYEETLTKAKAILNALSAKTEDLQ